MKQCRLEELNAINAQVSELSAKDTDDRVPMRAGYSTQALEGRVPVASWRRVVFCQATASDRYHHIRDTQQRFKGNTAAA